ncbi:DNA polymerase I [Huintestinicola sp.]|uniref:DNA polymerase I n=1 Tax=Huintestinicola sp. TaxID=2981661 RepID=UPI00307C936A
MKLLAIDGNSIMNRAFYGIKALSNKKGTFTNALTGFMNIYLKTAGDISPDCCAVAFDLKEPTFRHKASAAYKANRHGMPDELAMQMPLIKNILRDMGISVIECPGFEADDILGTLAASCGENDSAYILTGDRDSLQLITDNVTVLLHTTKELIRCTPEKFGEMYNGLEPKQLIDLKGLMGDSSDNISGVKGIGEKTALALISEYGSVEGLYEKLGKGEVTATKSVIAKLEVGAQDAKDSKWLATIVTDAPISRNIADYSYKEKDEAALSQLLTELEMTKLMEKLNIKPSAEAPSEAEKLPETEYTLSEMSVNDISGSFAFIFVTGEKPKLYVSYNEKLCCFEDEKDICSLLSSGFEKQTFGAKPAYRYCLEHGTELKNVVSDGDIAGYLLNASASEYTINGLCALYSCPSYEKLDEYADIAALSGLCTRLDKEISDLGMEKLYTETELPLTEVLASMEFYGVKADTDGIREFGNTLCGEIEGLEQQIYFRAGKQFNIASPKQLGAVLFEDLGLPSGKKTKTGYSTNADVLENLRDKDPIIDMIIMYRQYTKLQSTYVEGLLKAVSADGRIHSVFKQTETRTGRISSTEPNLQNIPVRTELGRNMRKFFVSEKGRTLIDADYSQIELRILAHLSGDKNMQESFISGKDIHTSTAAQVFGMPEDMVTPEMRRAAKAVNFGIVYGISAFSLAKDIDVSVAKADRYIKSYLSNFPKVKEFMDKAVADAESKGYSETIFGRRRYIPELAAKNKNIQSFGKRAAMNAPVQGAAADIIKIAMVKVFRRLRDEKLDAHLILQIHDELIIEASEKDSARAAQVLGEEMRNAVKLDIPLTSDVEMGKSWFECH